MSRKLINSGTVRIVEVRVPSNVRVTACTGARLAKEFFSVELDRILAWILQVSSTALRCCIGRYLIHPRMKSIGDKEEVNVSVGRVDRSPAP